MHHFIQLLKMPFKTIAICHWDNVLKMFILETGGFSAENRREGREVRKLREKQIQSAQQHVVVWSFYGTC